MPSLPKVRTVTSLLAALCFAHAGAWAADGACSPSVRRVIDEAISAPKSSGEYVNPIIGFDFPDPGFVRGDDGYFYAYGTQSVVDGVFHHIQAARSKDLVQWERIPDALPDMPSWGNAKPNTWAPDVSRHGSQYHMYYTAEHNEAKSMAIALAVSDSPAGPFRDIGHPLRIGPGFEDIDPHYFKDARTGKSYLYWGSGFKPIRGQELAEDGRSFKAGTSPVELVHPTPEADGYNRLQEAPWVIQRDGWYYMFYSGDDCFALYEVRVARSRSPLGPFETLGQATGSRSSAILKASDRWLAPGHNAIFRDDSGRDWILYHAIEPGADLNPGQPGTRRRPLLMDPLTYVDGWPRVQGDIPSAASRPAPVVHPRIPGKQSR